jgi:outer membrane protein
MKRIITAALLMLACAAPAMAASTPKIGVVDLQRAVSECSAGIEARADLLKKTEKYNAELKVLLSDFEKIKAEAEKDAAKLTADERAEREIQLQKKSRDFQNRQREAQEEIKLLEADHLKRITSRLGSIMAKVGDEGNYTAILDRSVGLFYFGKDADITAQVVQRANEEHAGNKK